MSETEKWWERQPPTAQKLKDGNREAEAVREPSVGHSSMPRWQWQQRLNAAVKAAESVEAGTETQIERRFLAMFVRELAKTQE